jgi:hypothetical protein
MLKTGVFLSTMSLTLPRTKPSEILDKKLLSANTEAI